MTTHSHTDAPEKTKDPIPSKGRAARFVPPTHAIEPVGDTVPLLTRDVQYEPAKKIYDRETTLDALTSTLDEQLTLIPASAPEESRWRLQALALIEQARGQHEDAMLRANHLRRGFELSDQDWQMLRRSHMAMHDLDEVEQTLMQSAASDDPIAAGLGKMSHARFAWLQEEPAERVALMCEFEPLSLDDDATIGFIETWRRQLLLDAQLSSGDIEAALASVDDLINDVPLPATLKSSLQVMQALWYSACGHVELARTRLNTLLANPDALLAKDRAVIIDVLTFLSVAQGEQAWRGQLLEQQPWTYKQSWPATMVGLLAQIARQVSAQEAAILLRENLNHHPEDVSLLSLYIQLLEQLHLQQPDQPQWVHELIRAQNLLVEQTKVPELKAEMLYRLGQLYELKLKDDVAAADVFVEALNLVGDHPQIFRALGRIYHRRQAWSQLAQLYSREIQTLTEHEHVWRRHYQVAKLYEKHLGDDENALKHYKAVLTSRPYDLPALKACARLLEKHQQWHQLADLFLCSVPQAKSQRQKLYLLDKVAEIAELHLKHDDVAIGAWEEILAMMPQHPSIYASLGRLYARNAMWAELVELNVQEMAYMEDEEELAGMYVRNASLFLNHLQDNEQAEQSYRAALGLVPDFLPALEGLGKMLVAARRWDDVIRMSSAEFAAMDDTLEQIRQLTTLAHLCETQLNRPEDAIKLYRATIQRDANNAHAFASLVRLYQSLEQWDSLMRLYKWKVDKTIHMEERVNILMSMASLCEWTLDDLTHALTYYHGALALDPQCLHAVDGMMRTWTGAGVDINQMIIWLGETVSIAQGESHHRHCIALARLHEYKAQMPEAGAGWRSKDRVICREHALLQRLTLGLFGDRQSMSAMRVEQPLHEWELLFHVPRFELDAQQTKSVDRALSTVSSPVRQWLAGEFELKSIVATGLLDQTSVVADVTSMMSDRHLPALMPENNRDDLAARYRLRALMARESNDVETYGKWSKKELESTPLRILRTTRMLEWYALCDKGTVQAKTVLVDAAQQAFPEMEGAALTSDIFDGPVMDWLYDTLYDARMWALLAQCIRMQVVRPNLGVIRKVYLYDMLADILERYLDDEEGALDAKIEAWHLSQDAEHLPTVVRLCLALDYGEQALSYQHELYEAMADKPLIPARERIEQGLALVNLMLKQEDAPIDDVLMMLDILLEDYIDEPEADLIRLRMAHVHAEYGKARTSAKLFDAALTGREVGEHLDDWCVYVELVAQVLNDEARAYSLQWQVVRCIPTDLGALDRLLELADACNRLEHCAGELVSFAGDRGPASQRVLLKSAALLFEEHLNMMEEAAEVYGQLAPLMTKEGDRYAMLRKRAWCLTRVLGKQHEALAIYKQLTGDDPFDTSAFEGMAQLLTTVHTMDRARVIEQVLRTLGQEVPSEPQRVKTIPSRPLDDVDEVHMILPESLSLPLFDAFSCASSFIDRHWADQLPDKRDLDNDKLAARDLEPVADLFAIMFDAIGIRRVRVLFGEASQAPFEIVWDKDVNIWLNINLMERLSEHELRYLAAYCAALVWTDLPAIRHLDGRWVWSLFDAVHIVQQQEGLKPGQPVGKLSASLAKQLAGARNSVMRRRIYGAVADAYETLSTCTGETWRRDMELFAHRFATTVCGDVEASVGCILKMEGWKYPLTHEKTQQHLRKNALCESMIRFALSEDYLNMRYALGLSGRPSALK